MNSRKLFRYLGNLSSKELRLFRRFLVSPWFNTNEKLVTLFDWLRPSHPSFDSSKLTKENIFAVLYPKEKEISIAKVNDNLSKFTRLVEQFLVQKIIDKEKYDELLIYTLGKRELHNDFEKEINKIVQVDDTALRLSWKRHLKRFEYILQLYFHKNTNQRTIDDDYLNRAEAHLENFYAIIRLKIGYEQISRKLLKGEKENIALSPELQRLLASNKNSDNPYLKLLYLIFNLHFNTKPYQVFVEGIEFFYTNESLFDKEAQLFFFLTLLNQGIALERKGIINNTKEILELYKVGLDRKYLLTDGILLDNIYINIVVLASKDDLSFASEFIEQYKSRLSPNFAEQAYILAKAYIDYNTSKYDRVVELLKDYNFSGIYYNFRAKGLLLRAWFESLLLGKAVAKLLKNSLETFTKYAKRKENKVHSDLWEGYYNFALILKHMIAIYEEHQWQGDLSDLQQRIQLTNPLVLREWLLKKVKKKKRNSV